MKDQLTLLVKSLRLLLVTTKVFQHLSVTLPVTKCNNQHQKHKPLLKKGEEENRLKMRESRLESSTKELSTCGHCFEQSKAACFRELFDIYFIIVDDSSLKINFK